MSFGHIYCLYPNIKYKEMQLRLALLKNRLFKEVYIHRNKDSRLYVIDLLSNRGGGGA